MTEQQAYDVVERQPDFELRRYPAHLRAEVEVDGDFVEAANRAFGVLVSYISGRNSTHTKVAMTAPVVQEAAPSDLSATTAVVRASTIATGRHIVSFVMPAEYSLGSLPSPADDRITIRSIPSELAAARTFSGRWTESAYERHLATLRNATGAAGLTSSGEPRFARFDPPWTPWFLRRNEVVLPVRDAEADRPCEDASDPWAP